MARNFFRFSLKIIPHGGLKKINIYSRYELVNMIEILILDDSL